MTILCLCPLLLITLETICDNIVLDGTLKTYLADIHQFLFFCLNHGHEHCLIEYCIRLLNSYSAKYPGCKVHYVVSKSKKEFKLVIRNCKDQPLIFLDRVQADTFGLFMLFIHKKDGKYYSKSSYGLKKSAVAHLFRCHNFVGFTDVESKALTKMSNSLFKTLLHQNALNAAAEVNVNGDDAEANEYRFV
jgi:hypothetical protein